MPVEWVGLEAVLDDWIFRRAPDDDLQARYEWLIALSEDPFGMGSASVPPREWARAAAMPGADVLFDYCILDNVGAKLAAIYLDQPAVGGHVVCICVGGAGW